VSGPTTEAPAPLVVPPDGLPADAFTPVHPRYGSGSLADLLPAALAVLGVPGTVDVLGLAEPLAGVRRIAVLLVDGLGAYQLPLVAPHAPALAALAADRTLTSGFPSTTPVSLVTLGTGTPPGRHGILGFTVRAPGGGVLNHIRGRDEPDPAAWQPVPTRFEQAAAAGLAVIAVTRPEFAGSGLTVAANRGAAFSGAADLDATAEGMLAALRAADGPALVYGYHPDLDHAGHVAGVGSDAWQAAAAGVGRLLGRLLDGLPPDTALLVTADHGQFNVPPEGRFDIAADPDLAAGVDLVAGEPRVRYLHVADGAVDDVVAAWRGVLGGAARVATRAEAVDGGWFGPVAAAHLGRIGDVVVTCLDRHVVLAGDHEPPAVGRLIGYHGSLTAAEMTVPLLVARA
jgi:hypothetical protein